VRAAYRPQHGTVQTEASGASETETLGRRELGGIQLARDAKPAPDSAELADSQGLKRGPMVG
jgi:hypothetical protein